MAVCIITIIAADFIGSISPAILIGRLYGVDIKKEGSGNAGTTNVLRTLGKKAAAATLIVDVLKGVAAVLLGKLAGALFLPEGQGLWVAMACAFCVLVGHIWPLLFGFKGGKGVATGFGALLALSPYLALSALGIVALAVLLTRRMSVGSICGALSIPILAYFFLTEFLWPGTAMALIVLIKHRGNIARLMKGQEPKLSFKK